MDVSEGIALVIGCSDGSDAALTDRGDSERVTAVGYLSNRAVYVAGQMLSVGGAMGFEEQVTSVIHAYTVLEFLSEAGMDR